MDEQGPPARSTSPLSGRAAQLAALERAYTDAIGGQTVAVALAGEPGSGKTRLLDALAARADGTRPSDRDVITHLDDCQRRRARLP